MSVMFVFSWHVLWVEGYSLHPAIGEAVAADVVLDEHLGMIQIPRSTHTYSGLAKKVVYHVDLHSQFIDLSGFESRFPPPGQPHTMPRTDQSARTLSDGIGRFQIERIAHNLFQFAAH